MANLLRLDRHGPMKIMCRCLLTKHALKQQEFYCRGKLVWRQRESKGEGGMLAGTQVSGKYGLMARAVRQAQIGNLSMMRGYCAHGPPWRRGMQVATKYRVMVRSEHWGRSSLCPGNLGNQGCYETDAANIDAGSAALLALCVLIQTLGDDAGPSFL